jgi:hypothetical protein
MKRTEPTMRVPAILLMALAASAQPPEGPDGIVATGPNQRFLTRKAGFWQPWDYAGGRSGATPAEAKIIDANLKRIFAVLMETPAAARPVGYYGLPDAGWNSDGKTAPLRQSLGIYPFDLVENKKDGAWKLDTHGETESIYYTLNRLDQIERAGTLVGEDAAHIYTKPRPKSVMGGFPIYSDTLYISRPGRELWKPVSVERALKAALPRYRQDQQSAEQRRTMNQKTLEQVRSPEFEQKEMANFEKEWGKLQTTDSRNYENRRQSRLAWIARQRQQAESPANPPRGAKESFWYWNPLDALADANARLASMTPQERQSPACLEIAANKDGRYEIKGRIVAIATACEPLVETNPDYFDRTLPRTAAQLLTVDNVTRCLPARPSQWPGGCAAHLKMWEQLDWQKLAAVLER